MGITGRNHFFDTPWEPLASAAGRFINKKFLIVLKKMENDTSPKSLLVKSILNLERKLGRRPTKWDSGTLYRYSRKYLGSWNNLMKAAGYQVKSHQYPTVPPYNQDFAYFLGLLVTDGTVYYNPKLTKYKVAIYTSYPEERDIIVKLVRKRICLASSGRNAFEFTLSPSRGRPPSEGPEHFAHPSGDAGLVAFESSVSKMLNKYKKTILL